MLTFEHLETLRVIARVRTFSEAAEELFLTQSAISQRVKHMEQTLGVTVLYRDRRRREALLTPEGERVLAFANSVIEDLRLLQRDLSSARSGGRNTVTFVTGGPFITRYVLPYLLARCREELPALRVSVKQAEVSHLNDAIRSGEADFAVQAVSQLVSDIAFVPFYTDRLILISPPFNPVVTHGLAALGSQPRPFVLPPKGTEARKIAEEWATAVGLKLDVVLESISFDTLVEAVRLGLGLSIVSEVVAREDLQRGDLAAAIVPGLPVERELCLAWDSARPLSGIANEVLDVVQSGAWRSSLPSRIRAS